MYTPRLLAFICLGLLIAATGCQKRPVGAELLTEGVAGGIYDFRVKTVDGQEVSLADYRGKVLLIVNVASQCGLTPQYEGLVALYDKYQGQGLEVLAFPCNQFNGQEPGSNEEIQTFCRQTYAVRFPVFAKIEVNGDGAHPLYQHLKEHAPGIAGSESIKWNFTKFLVARDGTVAARFSPQTKPEDLAGDIERLLAK
ncbi:MAG: glutathione peroxidase [Lentisphaeria bacterium]|jgi:glutathione peroxidase|nr:glutathione peroxidase [Lentisphaeria bacterium]